MLAFFPFDRSGEFPQKQLRPKFFLTPIVTQLTRSTTSGTVRREYFLTLLITGTILNSARTYYTSTMTYVCSGLAWHH
jgi:hypothetical protein